MMKVSLSIFLLVGLALAQQPGASPETGDGHEQGLATTATTHPVERVQTPSYGDRYCAGFITKEAVSTQTFVAGGLHSPHATKFVLCSMSSSSVFNHSLEASESERIASYTFGIRIVVNKNPPFVHVTVL